MILEPALTEIEIALRKEENPSENVQWAIERINRLQEVRSHPYQSEFDESTGRGYRCIHCEVKNDVQFCHYHDAPIKSERDKVLDEVIRTIEQMIDAERERGWDGAYTSEGRIKLNLLAHVSNTIKELRQKAGEQNGI
jgi:hypothetical protein